MDAHACSVCGRRFADGETIHSFGTFQSPVGDGEWIEVDLTPEQADVRAQLGLPDVPVVAWSGEMETIHYVECDDCWSS